MADVFGLAGDFTLADAPAAAWVAEPAGAEGGAASTAICGCSGRAAANDNAGVLAAAAEPDDAADWPWGKGPVAGVTGGDEEGDDGEGDDVTVIGRRPRVADDDDGGGGDTGAGGGVIGTGGGSGGGTGGGGGSPEPKYRLPLTPCDEREVDNRAWEAAESIKGNPSATPPLNPPYESGALIYRMSSGAYALSAFSTQQGEHGVDIHGVDIEGRGIPVRDIVGIVHNHTTQIGQVDVSNRKPSLLDWAMFDNLFTKIANAGGYADNLRTYVIGPDGTVRQYDSKSDRRQESEESKDTVFGTSSC